jgi:PDZ domain
VSTANNRITISSKLERPRLPNDLRLSLRVFSANALATGLNQQSITLSNPLIRKIPSLAVALALLLHVSAALAQSTPSQKNPTASQTAIFKSGTFSSGWIAFTAYTNFGIYLPVTVNGHEGMALLYGGPSNIDKNFVAAASLPAATEGGGSVAGLEVRVGDLTLQNATAAPADLQAQVFDARILRHPVIFRLGEEVFNQVVVDIDYAHHRVAFLDPKAVTKPAAAVEVPLIELDGERVVPLSINGAVPAQFELELGNAIGPLLVTPAYAHSQKLLEAHAASQRLSGPFVETVVSVDRLSFAGIDFAHVPIAFVPDTELPPASITGGVGLPLLSKFRLILDYSRDHLYAIPNTAAIKKPIEKDRIGLLLDKKSTDLSVIFVSPHSPAEAAGFKKGDKIALIDGKPFDAWPTPAIVGFQMADPGTTHIFSMADGTVRRIKAADFF